MTTPGIIFYEKPGCIGNRQQKGFLRAHGVALEVRDLLAAPWTHASLRPFFGDAPVSEWFNPSAPAVKSGALDVHACSEAQALQMMLADPLLIRRPLMQYGQLRSAGFDTGPVLEALGIRLQPGQDLQTCPMDDAAPQCASPNGAPA